MGNSIAIEIVVEYDAKIVHPFSLQVYNHLNHVKELIKLVTIKEDDIFFGQVVLVDDVVISILKNDLQSIQQLHV
jgi:hypothetical protein